MASTALVSEQRAEYIKALIEKHSAQRRDRAEASQHGRLLQAEPEKSLPAGVPLHKRGFGVMDEDG